MPIRPLQETDLPSIVAIEALTQHAPWSEEAFKRCLEVKYLGWVIENANQQVIGFTFISTAVGECHVLNLCIHPEHQKQGFGRQLLTYALAWAKEHGSVMVFLEVRRSNHAAIALYRKMNFKLIGERKNYYPHPTTPEDALIFARDLGMESIDAED